MYRYLRQKYIFEDGQDSLKVVTQYVSETFHFCSEMSRSGFLEGGYTGRLRNILFLLRNVSVRIP